MKVLYLFALFISFVSCSPKYLASKVKPTEIEQLEVFRPLTYMAQIEKENKGEMNDDLSHALEKMLVEEIFNLSPKMPMLSPVIIKDEQIQLRLEDEILRLCMWTSTNSTIKKITIPPTIDYVLESKGKRFGLIILGKGYERSNANFKWAKDQVIASNILSVLSFGVSSLPGVAVSGAERTRVVLNVMILDSKVNSIAFFNESLFVNKNKLDNTALNKELKWLFSKYFLIKK
jgi:hypothetical protein